MRQLSSTVADPAIGARRLGGLIGHPFQVESSKQRFKIRVSVSGILKHPRAVHESAFCDRPVLPNQTKDGSSQRLHIHPSSLNSAACPSKAAAPNLRLMPLSAVATYEGYIMALPTARSSLVGAHVVHLLQQHRDLPMRNPIIYSIAAHRVRLCGTHVGRKSAALLAPFEVEGTVRRRSLRTLQVEHLVYSITNFCRSTVLQEVYTWLSRSSSGPASCPGSPAGTAPAFTSSKSSGDDEYSPAAEKRTGVGGALCAAQRLRTGCIPGYKKPIQTC